MQSATVSQRYEDSLGYLVGHLRYAFRQGIVRRCQEAGFAITHEELGVMILLRHRGGATQTQLARNLAKDKAVVTRLLNGLVRKGWVERRPDAKDRRLVRAFLTPDGTRAVEHIQPLFLNFAAAALAGVSQRDYDISRRVLRRIIANLEHLNSSD